ncbi:hypothetical protein GCM10023340_16680 [Nocardioides marinquilinus]|uniref:DUF4307 domain-containing protein n=1 Tax=Nocardioides marinquilinus TaxID=1210400 RepID=A0ABP9PGH2_9ACTN
MTGTDLAERYGTPPAWRRRALLGAVAAVVLAFGVWLAWTSWVQASPEVSSGGLRYEVVDDSTVSATFTVDRTDPDVTATCQLRAYAPDKSIVGAISTEVEVGAGGQVTTQFRTTSRATAVELIGCTAPGQSRPR